ncbi:MAG: hypothetical protein AVDCRST_MAG52-2276, partial [uncultured Blastococcus sp.]
MPEVVGRDVRRTGRCLSALDGDLRAARRVDDLGAALDEWRSYLQRGDGLGGRIAPRTPTPGPGRSCR